MTYFWYDPHDTFAKLRVVLSGCRGCVSKNHGVTPYPSGELPKNAMVTGKVDPYTLSFQRHDTPYRDDGMVIVLHAGATIDGSFIVELWLPDKRQAQASEILSSIRQ